MITAELVHNPYLLETKIRFNNQEPRINSLAIKYEKDKLQSWIEQIPSIFHDEMNGYDFSLEFSGTKTDFEELKKAFAKAGVTSKQVRFVLKNELRDREAKLEKLNDLLDWLESNPNERFDYKNFRGDHEDLFDGAYPFILIQGRSMDVSAYEGTEIAVEKIDHVSELKNTELTSTPILFYLDRASLKDFQNNLRYITSRSDVIPEQIFFYVHPQLSRQKAIRLIQDLGISNPQIVKGLDDPSIPLFMELYPYTDYISDAIIALKKEEESISAVLKELNKKSEETHSKVHATIRGYDEANAKIKEAIDLFSHKDTKPIPEDWVVPKNVLKVRIDNWRKKKVKITTDEEAAKEAKEFDEEIQRQYGFFLETLEDKAKLTRDDLTAELFNDFMVSGIDKNDAPKLDRPTAAEQVSMENIQDELCKLKEERFVEKQDVFPGPFFWQNTPTKQLVKEVTYIYQDWRSLALKKALETADRQMQKYITAINQDYLTACVKYLDVLQKHLVKNTELKQKESKKLSGEEKKLQNDNDWLSSFSEQLHDIERG